MPKQKFLTERGNADEEGSKLGNVSSRFGDRDVSVDHLERKLALVGKKGSMVTE